MPWSLEQIATLHPNALVAWDRDVQETPRQIADFSAWNGRNGPGTAFWCRKFNEAGERTGYGGVFERTILPNVPWRWVLYRDETDPLGCRWFVDG